jgi:hypothetical protein
MRAGASRISDSLPRALLRRAGACAARNPCPIFRCAAAVGHRKARALLVEWLWRNTDARVNRASKGGRAMTLDTAKQR